jgi:hypothetical protein
MSAFDPKLRCPCGWEGDSSLLESVCVFRQTQEEPAEYESKCPACDRPFDELEEVPLCVSCEDVYVQEEGDKCGICVETEMEEALGFGSDAPGG